MTARQIQACLIGPRLHRNFVIPNYTPARWFECDLFEVTPARLCREYEIKLTRSDFKADTQKRNVKESWGERPAGEWGAARFSHYPPETKHGLLTAKSERGPSRFWYVTPKGLLTDGMLPEWAGLIEVDENGGGMLREREIHKAPILHRQPLDPKVYEHARAVCYWRYHQALGKLAALQRAYDKLKDSKTTTTPDTE